MSVRATPPRVRLKRGKRIYGIETVPGATPACHAVFGTLAITDVFFFLSALAGFTVRRAALYFA